MRGLLVCAAMMSLGLSLVGCAASVQRAGYTLDGAPADTSCDVVVQKHASFKDDAVTVLGTIKVGDSGFSTNCGEDDVLAILKLEACALDADVVNITEEKRPNIWSSCYRVTAVLLKMKEPSLEADVGAFDMAVAPGTAPGSLTENGTAQAAPGSEAEITRAEEDAYDEDAARDVLAGPMVVGVGAGFGSQYATMGLKGFAGTQHFLAEVAFGTEPFVWRGIYAAGGSVVLLDPQSRIRPKLSVLWKSNASSVVVWEKEQEGKIPGLQEYDPFPGIAILAGMLVRPVKNNPGSVEIAVGWRTPFEGMGAVERLAREYADRYAWVGSDVATPRWDHFTFSLGIHYPLDWR